jgi:hypothetical protein
MTLKVNNSYSEWFETKTGVRQGDPLSSLLFGVVLDSVITNLEIRGNITIVPVLSVSKSTADVYNVRTNVYLFFA